MVIGDQLAGGGQLLGIGNGVGLAVGLILDGPVGVNCGFLVIVGSMNSAGLMRRKGKGVGIVVGVEGDLRVTLAWAVTCSLAER
jgi:hypothetical protein